MITTIRGWINKIDWRVYAAIAIATAFLGLLIVSFSSYQAEAIKDDTAKKLETRDGQYQKVNTRLDTSEKDVEALKAALAAQIAQFKQCMDQKKNAAGCNKPVAPTPSTIVEGPEGKQGPGPTALQLLVAARQAIIEFCANDRCKGQPGNSPTDAQLLSIITQVHADYCAVRNECQGPKGDQGESIKGDTGNQGIQGEPGPTCPEGYTPELTTIVTNEGPVDAIVCRAAPPPSEETP